MAASELAAAQGLNYGHLIRRAQWHVQIEGLCAVDENAHMRPQALLLVNHAKSDPGKLPVQVGKHIGQRRANRVHAVASRVGMQWGRYQDIHGT